MIMMIMMIMMIIIVTGMMYIIYNRGCTSENPDSILVFLVSISGRVAARYPQYQSPKPKPLPQWRDVLADHANSIGPVGHRVVVPGSPFEKEVPDHQGVFTCQFTMHLRKVEDSH